MAEVVHCCPKEHHELVHRCEVLRKLHATRLHRVLLVRFNTAAAGPPCQGTTKQSGGRRREGQGYVARRKEVVHSLHDVGRMDRAVVPVGLIQPQLRLFMEYLSTASTHGALRVIYFGQRMLVPLAVHTRPTE